MTDRLDRVQVAGISCHLEDLEFRSRPCNMDEVGLILQIGEERLVLSLDALRELKRLILKGETKLLAQHDKMTKARNLTFNF